MPITKAAITVLAATSVAAGLTKATAVAGASIDCTGYYGGELTFKFTNGVAPTAACIIALQASHNGVDWYDYFVSSGSLVASDVTSNAVVLDRGVMFVRAIAYGNATNPVTVEAHLQAVTGV